MDICTYVGHQPVTSAAVSKSIVEMLRKDILIATQLNKVVHKSAIIH